MSTQVQLRTNAPVGRWFKCKSVTVQGRDFYCVLDLTKSYSLAEAYKTDLHIEFANADSDDKLAQFLRDWGPLSLPSEGISGPRACMHELDFCRAYRQKIRALIDALNAFRWDKDEREILVKLIEANDEVEHYVTSFDEEPRQYTSGLLANHLGISGNVQEWAKHASLKEVHASMDYLIEHAVRVSGHLKLRRQKNIVPRQVDAGWELLSLKDALLWMVWYDEFNRHPVVCCAECREVFRGKTARARKYCKEKCAHKATARVAMKNKRDASRSKATAIKIAADL